MNNEHMPYRPTFYILPGTGSSIGLTVKSLFERHILHALHEFSDANVSDNNSSNIKIATKMSFGVYSIKKVL